MGLYGMFQDVARQISKTTPFDFDGITKALRYNANDVARSYANRQGVKMGSELKSMRKALNAMDDTSSKAYKELAESISKKQEAFSAVSSAHRAGDVDSVNAAFKEITGKDKIGINATLDGYFGDAKYGGTRKKVAAGVLASTAVGTRHLSGGNMTTNAQGERDIAGIPFI